DAREAAFGSGPLHSRHESDDRRFLPRIAEGGSFLRAKEKCPVNAGAKMHRFAGAKMHQRCSQKSPELGAFSSGIKLRLDCLPMCPS
ncbi:MAG TPA: hypothetical protein VFR21_31475, partial [Bradyrhizobium sp.]|nr:hypothetical protein [Bradyrhizobium sp.]